jgi:hypothetical protein
MNRFLSARNTIILRLLITFALMFSSGSRATPWALKFVSAKAANGFMTFTYSVSTMLPVMCTGVGSPTNPGGSWDIGYPGYGYPGPAAYAQCTWNGYQYSSQWLADVVTLQVPLGLIREGVCPTVIYRDYGISDEYPLTCTLPPLVQPLSCSFGSASDFIIRHGDVPIADAKNITGNAVKAIDGNITCTGSGSGTVKLTLLNSGWMTLATDAGGTLRTMLTINNTLGSAQINVAAGSTTFELRSTLSILNNYSTPGNNISGSTTLRLEIP